LAVVDRDFLILDPGALEVAQRLVRPFDALHDRVLEALVADAADFGDACDAHRLPSARDPGSGIEAEGGNWRAARPSVSSCQRLESQTASSRRTAGPKSTGPREAALSIIGMWRARQDSNPRPLGS